MLLLLTACGGGSDAPGAPPAQPPVATWRAPQIAPASSSSVLLVQSDGADGVFVVGSANDDGLIVQRFSASAGWFGQTVELRGLKNLQVVALDDGVALFGRDETSWYRRDYTATGLKPLQTMFAVDFRGSARTDAIDEVFSRTHDGAILATAFTANSDTLPRALIQTREFRAGAWSPLRLSPVLLPNGYGPQFIFSNASVVRSKAGDVARVRHQLLYWYTYVAYRAANDDAFVAVTPELCLGGRCGGQSGSHDAPILEMEGTATVAASRGGTSESDEWLAVRGTTPTSLWPPRLITKLESSAPLARLLRGDGTPMWLTSAVGALALWEGTARVDWSADAAGLVPCLSMGCAAISSPDAAHVAVLQSPASGAATLYVSDRGGARWAQSAALDASTLQVGTMAGKRLKLTRFYAKGNTQIVVGYAEALTPASEPQLVWPFAFVKR